MDRAALLLARAWRKAWRGWWLASAATLAAVLVLVLGTAGLLDGMQRATQATVADFYTGDLRITVDGAGAAPDARFAFADDEALHQGLTALEKAGGHGSAAIPRLETTYILSRRSLLEAYLVEQDQYGVAVPGVDADRDAYRIGVLTGLPMEQQAAQDLLKPYLVAGTLPQAAAAGNGSAPMQVLMSLRQFRGLLDPAERAVVADPPSQAALTGLRLEITAAHIDPDADTKDIVRFPARVVGVFDSGVETLDRLTVVAPLQDVRRLVAADPDGPAVNAITVVGGDTGSMSDAARDQGWVPEGPAHFTHRYLGQLVDVVRLVGLAVASLLLAIPFFLVWVGLSQQLDRSRRELAVCRALGLPLSSVRRALVLLAGRILVGAVVSAAVILALVTLAAPSAIDGQGSLPVPLGFHVPLWAIAATLANLAVATAIALWGALHRHQGLDLASTLRAL